MDKEGCIVPGGWYVRVETEKLNVTDMTGADNAFSAGLILGRLGDMNEVKCAKLGNETVVNFLKGKMELLQ